MGSKKIEKSKKKIIYGKKGFPPPPPPKKPKKPREKPKDKKL